MRSGISAYLQKPLIIAHSGVSKCLKVVRSFLQLAYFIREAKTLAMSCMHAVSSERSSHADVTRTIISCADLFIVKRKCD